MISKETILAVLFLFGSAMASAQIGGGAGGRPVPTQGQWFSTTAGFPGTPMPAPTVTGMPFSGVREYEHTQTLADGTHISQKNTMQKIWRDADGRMRTERSMGSPTQAAQLPGIVEITDPIAGFRYALDDQKKIAHRTVILRRPMPPLAPAPPAGASPGAPGANSAAKTGIIFTAGSAGAAGSSQAARRQQLDRESLGAKTIDGVPVEGTRMTITIPAGEQGNDRPISTVTERWFSPDLRETIESTTSDPRSGETISRLTNIDRNNPDPALFQVPPDYEIVDEQGPFSINYHR